MLVCAFGLIVVWVVLEHRAEKAARELAYEQLDEVESVMLTLGENQLEMMHELDEVIEHINKKGK